MLICFLFGFLRDLMKVDDCFRTWFILDLFSTYILVLQKIRSFKELITLQNYPVQKLHREKGFGIKTQNETLKI